jgi:uncharacterized spore protein YtfJ
MAAPDKSLAPPTKIKNVVHTLLDGLHSMSKSETIMGDPYTLGDATIVPVHRLRVALGAGAVEGGAKQDATSGQSGGLGAGGAVQIEPVAVIAVGRDSIPRIMCVESENDAAEKLVKQLPELLQSTTKVFSERIAPLLSKLLSRASSPAKEALAAPTNEAPALPAAKK